jgi:general stress protein 26
MADDKGMSDEQALLWERVADQRVAMLTTVDEDGALRSRPMWTQGDRFDGTLWFFISKEAPASSAVARESRVCLSYSAPDADLYVSVVGRGELVEDKPRAKELWNVYAEAWFPAGVDDPRLRLLRIDVEEAEIWEDKKPKLLQFAEVVLGAVTGNVPRSGEKKELEFED